MAEHTVKQFDAELEDLASAVAQMGGLAENQLAAAIEAIAKRDTAMAEQAIASDVRIDALLADVEAKAVRLLALRAPVASDLRNVIAALKMSIDLERIGDLAKNIAKRALVLNRENPLRLTQGLARMGIQALAQLKTVLDAYSDRDADAAVQVWRRDGEIDELYNSLFRELLTYMMEDPRVIGLCTHLLFVAKNIERIGDHATNIAETIHFSVTGANIRDERPKSDDTASASIPYTQAQR